MVYTQNFLVILRPSVSTHYCGRGIKATLRRSLNCVPTYALTFKCQKRTAYSYWLVLTCASDTGIFIMATVVLEVANVGAVCYIQLQSIAPHIIQYNWAGTLTNLVNKTIFIAQ